jgi:hypothetical protein
MSREGDLLFSQRRFQEALKQCDLEAALEPMNEYELAQWRLDQLTGLDGATSQPNEG